MSLLTQLERQLKIANASLDDLAMQRTRENERHAETMHAITRAWSSELRTIYDLKLAIRALEERDT